MAELMIIGGGLAGCEAAWQAAERGTEVVLYEMRPSVMTPAHQSGRLAELVCSNSLKSELLTSAHGLLKEEMRMLGSVVISCAEESRVPAGQALAVDRDLFADKVTQRIESHPRIEVRRREVTEIPADRPLIIATGPLTSDALAAAIAGVTGSGHLHFYDAIAPSVEADSIDMDICYRASRYGRGEGYINCPFHRKEDYLSFTDALISAEKAPLHDLDQDARFFEGCLPVEEIAERGPRTLAYGPMRPVGLADPKTGERPYAVVQLRQENVEGTVYGLVGFQTRLKWPEQERVFRMIPGLERARFVRFGQIHRNTFIDSPRLLEPTLQLRSDSRLIFAGQITGVEGYVESSASGLVAGLNAARLLAEDAPILLPRETMIGAMLHYIATSPLKRFQPMNSNFGILPPLVPPEKKDEVKRAKMVERALCALQRFRANALT